MTKIFKDLRSLDIELVMFIDGAKGSSRKGTEQKLETWKQRHYRDMTKMQDLLDVLNGTKQIEDVPDTTSVRPVCLEIQVLQSLRNCECQIVQLASGEADYVLAKNLRVRPKAYAVISNDSDFCLFENCLFIPNDMFDMKSDLQLGSDKQWLPEQPIRLVCGAIASKKVMRMLEVSWIGKLVKMCIS